MAEVKTQTLDGYLRLIEIARDLASTLDLDTLLNDIVHASADITHAEAASILLYDDTARQLYFQVATNIDEPTMRGLIVPLEKSIAGWIVTNRQSVRIDDAHKDTRFFSDVEQSIGYATRSLLGIPLITKNKSTPVVPKVHAGKVLPNSSRTGPANHNNRSTWWMAWFINAPPPSVAQLPFTARA